MWGPGTEPWTARGAQGQSHEQHAGPAAWSSHGSYSPWLRPPCSFHFVFSLSHKSCPVLVWRAFESCHALCQCLFAASTRHLLQKELGKHMRSAQCAVTSLTRHCDQWQNCHLLQPATSTWVGTEVVAFGAPPADTLNALSLSFVELKITGSSLLLEITQNVSRTSVSHCTQWLCCPLPQRTVTQHGCPAPRAQPLPSAGTQIPSPTWRLASTQRDRTAFA